MDINQHNDLKTAPFGTLRFQHKWRPYQERVLNAVNAHLDDRRLHIVAAPGAGKTTLGLEIFRILEKPALALSPTRIIRDQWIERLTDFCDTDDPTTLKWVSNSSHAPRLFTSIAITNHINNLACSWVSNSKMLFGTQPFTIDIHKI